MAIARWMLAVGLLGGAACALGQVTGTPPAPVSGLGSGTGSSTMTSSLPPAPVYTPRPTKPYSMVQRETTVETCANGLVLRQVREIRVFVDGNGRTRHDSEVILHGESQSAPGQEKKYWSTYLSDPAAGTFASWSTQPGSTKSVRITHTRAEVAEYRATPRVEGPQSPSTRPITEQLGEKTVEGVTLRGTRMTARYPVGALGNNQEFDTVREFWTSTGFSGVFEALNDDPRRGRTETALVSFTAGEPDPSVFAPPADYRIADPEKP